MAMTINFVLRVYQVSNFQKMVNYPIENPSNKDSPRGLLLPLKLEYLDKWMHDIEQT